MIGNEGDGYMLNHFSSRSRGAPATRLILGCMVSIALNDAALADVTADSPADGSPTAAPSTELQEVVVTAEKRSESVQRTALAVTALNADMLAQRGMSSVGSIAQDVPGLNVTEQIGQARITLRGIGVDNIATGAESSIAFNEDGVFYSRSAAALASFYDLSRIEVLRGPQGTLYGRNATGGSVNLISAAPTPTLSGYVGVTGGNYATADSEGAVSGPISDGVLGRLSFQTRYHDGYGTNLVTGKDVDSKNSQAVRGQLQLNPSDRLTALFKVDYYRSNDTSNGYHDLGAAGGNSRGGAHNAHRDSPRGFQARGCS